MMKRRLCPIISIAASLISLGLAGFYYFSNACCQVEKPRSSTAALTATAESPASPAAAPAARLLATPRANPKTTDTPAPVDIPPCEQNPQCVPAEQDPRAKAFAEAAKTQAQLEEILMRQYQTPIDDPQYAQLARQYFTYPDGHVQETALDLMATVSPEADNIKVIVKVLDQHPDGRLFQVAMQEFQRYPAEKEQAQIHGLLTKTLENGAFFAAQEVARSLLPLINQKNLQRYQEVLSRLPPQSAKAMVLKNVLEEYQRLTNGG